MILARKLMMASVVPPRGQQIYTTATTHSFIVPAGVYSICCAAVGAGGDGAARPGGGLGTERGNGGGGACAWTNNIPVTPGEALTVIVGSRRQFLSNAAGGQSLVRRGSTNLVLAAPGMSYTGTATPGVVRDGVGGLAANCIGANRFSGRDGGVGYPIQGGSAAGPRGAVVSGAEDRGGYGVSFSATSFSVTPPFATAPQRLWGASYGAGAGVNEAPSATNDMFGAGGTVCIIWGPGRGFSTTSNDY